jgi:hypothetical protein
VTVQKPPPDSVPEDQLTMFLMEHPEAQDWFYTMSVMRSVGDGTRYRHMTGRVVWLPHQTRMDIFNRVWDLYRLDQDYVMLHWSLEPNGRPWGEGR